MNQAVKLLRSLKQVILRHAIEEKARMMRVIMEKAKSDSAASIKIMQEHRWVSEFFERRLQAPQRSSRKGAGRSGEVHSTHASAFPRRGAVRISSGSEDISLSLSGFLRSKKSEA